MIGPLVQQFEKESRMQVRSYLDAAVIETAKGTVFNITNFTLTTFNRYLLALLLVMDPGTQNSLYYNVLVLLLPKWEGFLRGN